MISIIYLTNRIDPKFEWFIDSLCNQTSEADRKEIELIFIDYSAPRDIAKESEFWNSNLYSFCAVRHSKPKPSIYQGEGRKTTGEYFGTSNARNTGVILSTGEYLVFVDDVSVLSSSWWGSVKKAADRKMIVCGSYRKDFDMVVEKGRLVSSRQHQAGKDARRGNGDHIQKIQGGSLYGCSLGIPAEDLLSINGFDELCDSIGGEDYHFGIRLNHAGKSIFFDPKMFTIESEELHVQPYLMKREDRVLSPEQYLERLKTFGIDARNTNGNWDSSHMILDILYGLRSTWTTYNNYNLAECRQRKEFPVLNGITNHWFDNKPLTEMI